MTAIAYRDGVMASDASEANNCVVVGSCQKIAKRQDGALAGAAGDSTLCYGFLEAFKSGRDAEYKPEVTGDRGFVAILVEASGTLWSVDQTGRFPLAAAFAACGCAHDLLIGAMAQGATAEEAVAIAIKFNQHCGGDVQVERL